MIGDDDVTETEPTPTPEPTPETVPDETGDGPEVEDDGSGPSSHETSGPGGDVDPRDDPEEGPSSHETSGTDPAAEVRATFDE